MKDKLPALRAHIDALDEKIQALISERASVAQDVAEVKQVNGDESGCYRPEREAEVLHKVLSRNKGPLADQALAQLFREIMSQCRALEEPTSVAFLGPPGTYSQGAVLKHFGRAVQAHPAPTIDQVFRDVERGCTSYGVVPVENSSEGVINHTLDLFVDSPLKICGEIDLRIHHCLLGQSMDSETITCVYGHEQSLAQCRAWLDRHLPGAQRVAVSSNAEAARRAAEEISTAAIAGHDAAEIYKLKTMAANIEDENSNTTRFLVVGKHAAQASGNDKTSLILNTRNQAGGLHRLLEPFAVNAINLTRIESRPTRQSAWEYLFFVDVEGHAQDPALADALEQLGRNGSLLKILGSYPKALP
jgi:chorismate mutase/prephenate dehydratase